MKKSILAVLLLQASVVWAGDVVALKVTSTDGKLEPQVLEAPAGKAIELTVVNAGKSSMEFESKPLKIEQNVAAGKSKVIKIKALAAGEYKYVDELHEEQASGQGVLIVK